MPQVLKDLLSSEKGFIALALIIAVTVLTALGKVPIERWEQYTMVIFGSFAAGNGLRAVGMGLGNKRENDALRARIGELQGNDEASGEIDT